MMDPDDVDETDEDDVELPEDDDCEDGEEPTDPLRKINENT